MYTMSDLERILGHSRAQIRWRLAALARIDGLLDDQVVVGLRGRKEYSPGVLEMLKEVDSLAINTKQSVEEATKELARELKRERGLGYAQADSGDSQLASSAMLRIDNPFLVMVLEEKEKRLEEKERRIALLEAEVQYLRQKVEELMPLALPRPRRSVLGWLRRSRGLSR